MKDAALQSALDRAAPEPGPARVSVDGRGFVRVEGVVIGRRVVRSDGAVCLEICDKDRRRSAERGSRLCSIPLSELAAALESESQQAVRLCDSSFVPAEICDDPPDPGAGAPSQS